MNQTPSPNHKSNSAGEWLPATVRGILRNKLYAGVYWYGKTRMIKKDSSKRANEVSNPNKNGANTYHTFIDLARAGVMMVNHVNMNIQSLLPTRLRMPYVVG